MWTCGRGLQTGKWPCFLIDKAAEARGNFERFSGTKKGPALGQDGRFPRTRGSSWPYRNLPRPNAAAEPCTLCPWLRAARRWHFRCPSLHVARLRLAWISAAAKTCAGFIRLQANSTICIFLLATELRPGIKLPSNKRPGVITV
jgi:hypothetical protein